MIGNSKEEEEAEEDTKKKTEKKRKATVETLATIADNCNNILAFLQSVAVKSPRVIATPLSLRTNKQARVWFCWWYNINLPASSQTSPQDHTGIMVFLSDVATRLKSVEALHPVAAEQHNVEKETKGWDRILPTAQ